LAPILKKCKGKVSIKFDYSSLIDSTMSPVLSTINGYGRLQSDQIQVIDSETLNKLGDLLNFKNKIDNEFNDVNISFTISDGRIFIEPFETNMGDIKMELGGSHGIDQTLDYDMALSVPREYIGSAANKVVDGLLSQAAAKGVNIETGEYINVKAKIIGTTTEPKITLDLKDSKSDTKKTVKEKVTQEIDKKKEEVRQEAEEKAQQIIAEAEAKAAKIKQEARDAADKILADGKKEADALVAKAAKEGPLAKIAAQKTADELEKKAKQKADKMIEEADARADKLVENAKEEAKKIKNK